MSIQRDPQAACEGKQRFGSYTEAALACRRQNRRHRRVEVFHCSVCRGWHKCAAKKHSLQRWWRRREELRRAGVRDEGGWADADVVGDLRPSEGPSGAFRG